ncbi:MAG: hypothetical protein ACYDBY_15900 [Thermoanaerobaculia bacterium]
MTSNIFWVGLTRNEPVFFTLLALATAALVVLLREDGTSPGPVRSRLRPFPQASALALLAALAFGLALWGRGAVLRSLDFSMDEYGSAFQAHIFAGGRVSAPIAEEWRPFATALTPLWIRLDTSRWEWVSAYLPGFAAIRAAFIACRIEAATNPVLAAATVLALFGAARRLWPDRPREALLAAALLVITPQFLVAAMSGYSMPAHLLLNCLWLLGFLSPGRSALLLTPWIGGAALLLHQPVPHALFAAPFLLRLAREGRFRRLSYFAFVYAVAAGIGAMWLRFASLPGKQGLLDLAQFPRSMHIVGLHAANVALLFAWLAPAVPLLFVVAAICTRRLGVTERDLLGGVVLTLVIYIFFPTDQGHGWGYRYAHNVLGNVVLLAVSGWRLLAPSQKAGRALLGATVFGAGLLLPLRLVTCERFVTPFARAHADLRALDASVVVVDPVRSWYGIDFVRNDPFLRTSPRVMSALSLSATQRQELARRYGRKAIAVDPELIGQAGVPSWAFVTVRRFGDRPELVFGPPIGPSTDPPAPR